ncbi:MAG: polymer-forming cytoskeletal protein [Longimicrobiales bacterium]|nr:polymer-forming cytoskeletal protein [Longimicrobiales bacterium]
MRRIDRHARGSAPHAVLVPVLAVALMLAPAPGDLAGARLAAQTVEVPRVLSKMVSMGPREARLMLELESAPALELALREGEVRMGGEVLGSYTPGDELDRSWRTLVGEVLALEDEALLQALVDWSPPEGLTGDQAGVARRMDDFLTRNFDTAALRARTLAARPDAEALGDPAPGLLGAEERDLLGRVDALAGLGDVLGGLTAPVRVVVDETVSVAAGSEMDASVLVVEGTLRVDGTVRGDVVAVESRVELSPGARIAGSLRLVESTLVGDADAVEGGVTRVDVRAASRDAAAGLREEILREVRSDLTRERDRGRRATGPVRRVFRGLGEIFSTLVNVLVLGLLGAAFFHFAGPRMETVAETARASTGRAALVGLSGAALTIPAFILGIVGLAVTIVGIPALLLWIPLFPAAVLVAVLMGYLAVARNLGIWLERQHFPYTEWIRLSNPVTLVFGGLLALTAPFVAGHVLGLVGFLGFLAALLKVSGMILTLFAGAVGLGAVLLTRGGTQAEEWDPEIFTRAWRSRRRAYDPEAATYTAGAKRDDADAAAFDAELAREADPREAGEEEGER